MSKNERESFLATKNPNKLDKDIRLHSNGRGGGGGGEEPI